MLFTDTSWLLSAWDQTLPSVAKWALEFFDASVQNHVFLLVLVSAMALRFESQVEKSLILFLPLLLQPYHITNDEPVLFWDFMSEMLVGLGYAAPRFHLPYWLVYGLALLLWLLTWILHPFVSLKHTFTPMRVALAGTHHYYSCQRAKEDLGYKPVVSLKEGIARTVQSYPHLRHSGTNWQCYRKSHFWPERTVQVTTSLCLFTLFPPADGSKWSL